MAARVHLALLLVVCANQSFAQGIMANHPLRMRSSPLIEYQMFRAAVPSTVFTWVVERRLFWLNRFRRLKIRYEHRADIHLAFLQLGCALIFLRFLG